MDYLCPSCNNKLSYHNLNYKCSNPQCQLKDAIINVVEGWHDVVVMDEHTDEVRKEKQWCTIYNIKY
jgi:hypothetical protein